MLRDYRRSADLTLEGLAELSGISDRTISDIERGISAGPQRRTMLALSDALRLSRSDRDAFLAAARVGRRMATGDGGVFDLEPSRLADFTGRADEVGAVVAHLTVTGERPDVAPLVIICGAPGVGKTTVAVEALHRFGVRRPAKFFVNLGGFDAMPLSPLKVLQALLGQGRPDSGAPATLSKAAAAWNEFTASSPAAVLLDDATSEAQIRPVLGAGRNAVIVVTSRRSLAGMAGAGRITMGALSEADSEELLRRIIPKNRASTGDLAELARLCDHIPLALRIAGNRLASQPLWSVEDLAGRLRSEERRLRTLVAGDLAVESAFALSYDYLDPASKQLFRLLSLIEGPSFDATLAAAIGPDDSTATGERLDALADLGLIESSRGNRYRIHELLRLFAASRLRAEVPAADISDARRRLREWLLATTAIAERPFETGGPGESGAFSSRDHARQ